MANRFLGAFFFAFISHLCAMDQPSTLTYDNNAEAWEVIVRNFDMENELNCLRRISLTNHINNRFVKTGEEKREPIFYITDNMLKFSLTLLWSLYKRKCAFVRFAIQSKVLVLHSKTLMNGCIHSIQYSFANVFPWADKPFYNDKSMLCYYGVGQFKEYEYDQDFNIKSTVMKESLVQVQLDGKRFFCYMDSFSSHDPYPYPLVNFIEYPLLLKALLNSTRVQCKKMPYRFMKESRYGLCYSLKGVTLPFNYKNRVESSIIRPSLRPKSFDKHFPEHITKAINDHYQQQNQKKIGDASTL